jgi:puromycin-sensitive aminopeptidase
MRSNDLAVITVCSARRDEPARKATFSLTLVVPPDMQALSNMPLLSSAALTVAEPDRPETLGWRVHSFDPTPVMSSYLLAFAIGQFESIQTTTKAGVIVRLLTPLGKISEGDFSLDFARRCLEFYSDYFAVPFPLPKMDLLAVPDIAITAMENCQSTIKKCQSLARSFS